MKQFNTIADLQQYLNEKRQDNAAIGFVPTMGALHEGHLSLIRAAKATCDFSVCSVFVNPTQFDDKGDLDRYPRTLETDAKLLTTEANDVLFAPSVDDIYPPGLNTAHGVDFGHMASHMEGAHRPGHFDGMAQVVRRLVDIVGCTHLFMGQKDYQQQALCREMFRQLNYDVEVVTCPIAREADGLAMSSRNRHLSPEERKNAAGINMTLRWAKEAATILSPLQIIGLATDMLNSIPGARMDYFEIVDGITLERVNSFDEADTVVACTTVRIGKVRLLDNMILKAV